MKLSLELISHVLSNAKTGELICFSSKESPHIPIMVTDTFFVSLDGHTVFAHDIFNWNVNGFKVFETPREFLKSIGWIAPKKS